MKHIKKKLVLETLAILITCCNVFSQQINCDKQVTFDYQALTTFGASQGDVVGDVVFTESGFDIQIDSMLWNGGSRGYNFVEIEAADCGFGYNHRAWFNNASLIFDFSSVTTDGVSFIYWDMGGEENLQVNGSTEHVISKFEDLPYIVAPNVLCIVNSSVDVDVCYSTDFGSVTLIGNIDELRIAGQELAIDSICIDESSPVTIPDDFECETQVSFDDQALTTYGASQGDIVGDVVFAESGIDVTIDSILWSNGSLGYNFVEIEAVDCGFGFDQRAWFNNASLIFDLNSITTEGVSFIYWDRGGQENLQVNGATRFIITDFMALPSVVASGVTCTVDIVYEDNCYAGDVGRVTLLGDIDELRIAGQELAIDSICIDEVLVEASEDIIQNSSNGLSQNYPNPFSKSTSISYNIPEPGNVSLKVFDIHGREIQELVNEYQTSNRYTVNFNAELLPCGIYYYKLQVNELVDIQKMLLVK